MDEVTSDAARQEVVNAGGIACGTQDGFIHRNLDPSQQQIRLLKICAGNQANIDCDIAHFNFAELPPYRAVSYTWGPAEHTTAIDLNGLPFHVRRNLWDFLHVAEDKFPDTWLWVDALCIDQDNLEERNCQVRLMQYIFGRAEEVLSWIGLARWGFGHSDLLTMINTGLYSAYSARHEIKDDLLLQVDKNDVLLKRQIDDTRRFLKFVQHNYLAIEIFFAQSYWRRIWIIQEVRFARKHLVIYGRTTITASKLNQFITSIRNRGSWKEWHFPLTYQYAWAVLNPPSNVAEFSLSNVVLTYQKSLCTDLRDRIFGVMSLVNENVRMEIDYGISAFELYFLTLGRIAQTEWIHQSKETIRCTEELKLALGLCADDADDIDDSFARLFVDHAIRCRPRLLTLEKWLGVLEQRAKKRVTGKRPQKYCNREGHSLTESITYPPMNSSVAARIAASNARKYFDRV
ncbi:hypothetical protein BLS_009928 [Venturia inaequalis]|uniref:Heterokaryon incompatibility domain-containing protein n=1 Tax=Venturia inaequalis TaxID=5025 RepID=A0A8H3UKW2_VENIN|nr:hypothetical protein BLS_009928 [Venturia inaequalis]KAE9971930.1 hypothetical protein EG328_005302 [Venturia inaequalis]RDI78224.1 hypothetical protein Vi05172_g11665 [Venturia inaequalis]